MLPISLIALDAIPPRVSFGFTLPSGFLPPGPVRSVRSPRYPAPGMDAMVSARPSENLSYLPLRVPPDLAEANTFPTPSHASPSLPAPSIIVENIFDNKSDRFFILNPNPFSNPVIEIKAADTAATTKAMIPRFCAAEIIALLDLTAATPLSLPSTKPVPHSFEPTGPALFAVPIADLDMASCSDWVSPLMTSSRPLPSLVIPRPDRKS